MTVHTTALHIASAPLAPGRHQLPSGELHLHREHGSRGLDDLLTLGVRQNPRRGFLFVSKVLARHLPIRPFRLTHAVSELAGHLQRLAPLPGPVLFVAMAETATGLGEALAREYATRAGRTDVLVTTTTRRSLPLERLEFDEAHSHAPTQRLYLPDPATHEDPGAAREFRRARSLVLVDDEVTTGRTLSLLARQLLARGVPAERVVLANLVDWLTDEGFAPIEAQLAPAHVERVFLGGGAFTFTPDPAWTPRLPEFVEREAPAPRGSVRETLRAAPRDEELDTLPVRDVLAALPPGRPVLVLGTGEHAYRPYLLAHALEHHGVDVHVQTMSRSPVHPHGAVRTRWETVDDGGSGAPLYAYNLPGEQDATRWVVLLCTEGEPGALRLPAHLDVRCLVTGRVEGRQ